MRTMLLVLLAAMVLAPGAVAEDPVLEEPMKPLDHGADDSHDSPSVGVAGLVGVAAVATLMRRRA